MWGLLKRLGSDCWGDHDWIAKANAHGLWLECRHCGQESAGLELPPVRYHRTQEGADEAHRLGGVPPAVRSARAKAAPTPALRFSDRRAVGTAPIASTVTTRGATQPTPVAATTDDERRWLQAFRALSPHERRIAERMIASLRPAALGGTSTEGQPDDRLRRDRLVG